MFWRIGITARNEARIFLLIVVLLSAMLLPAFSFHGALPSLRLDEFALFACFGLNMLYWAAHRFRKPEGRVNPVQKKNLRRVYLIFALMTVSYAVSNIYAHLFLPGAYTMRDVMELVTYFKYFLVITLALSVDFGTEERRYLQRVFLVAVGLLILLGWGQHLNPLHMNTWLSPFFDQSHWEHLIVGNPARVLGTFDNPNVFGLVTVLILSLLTTRYYFAEDKGKFPWLLFLLIGLVIKLEYLTISRTALFGIALLFGITSIWAFFYHRKGKGTVKKIVALFLLTMILFLTASSDFLNRVYEGMDFSNSTSFQGHVDRWETAAGSIWDSPVVGWGTQKTTMTTLVDNEYALFTRRYGFVGLAVYLALFLTPWILAWKKLRKNRQAQKESQGPRRPFTEPQLWLAAYVAVLPAVFTYNFMAGIFYHLQLMTAFGVLIGLVYGAVGEEN